MVGNDDGLVTYFVGSGHYVLDASVDGYNGFGNGIVDARVAYHVAVGKVNHDEVVLVLLDGSNEFVLHFVSGHLGLEIVGSNLGRGYEDAVFTFVGRFASTVEEESHVGVLLCLCSVELCESVLGEIFAEGVLHVFLRIENVHALEGSVVRSHAVVLQAGNGVHAFFGHVLLSEHDGKFLGAVVAVVEEDDNVAFLDASVYVGINEGFHELVGVLVVFAVAVVAALHAFNHVGHLAALAFNELVVGNLHTVPALVAVHGVETTNDAGDVCTVCVTYFLKVGNEAFAALGVGVAAVHEAVNVGVFGYAVFFGNLHEFEEVLEGGVNATGRGEAHEVESLAVLLGVFVG